MSITDQDREKGWHIVQKIGAKGELSCIEPCHSVPCWCADQIAAALTEAREEAHQRGVREGATWCGITMRDRRIGELEQERDNAQACITELKQMRAAEKRINRDLQKAVQGRDERIDALTKERDGWSGICGDLLRDGYAVEGILARIEAGVVSIEQITDLVEQYRAGKLPKQPHAPTDETDKPTQFEEPGP